MKFLRKLFTSRRVDELARRITSLEVAIEYEHKCDAAKQQYAHEKEMRRYEIMGVIREQEAAKKKRGKK